MNLKKARNKVVRRFLFSKAFIILTAISMIEDSSNYMKSLIYAHLIYYILYGLVIFFVNNPFKTEKVIKNIYDLMEEFKKEFLKVRLFNSWNKRQDYLFLLERTLLKSEVNEFKDKMILGRENIAQIDYLFVNDIRLRWVFDAVGVDEYYYKLLYNPILYKNKESQVYLNMAEATNEKLLQYVQLQGKKNKNVVDTRYETQLIKEIRELLESIRSITSLQLNKSSCKITSIDEFEEQIEYTMLTEKLGYKPA